MEPLARAAAKQLKIYSTQTGINFSGFGELVNTVSS